jgi:O-succinylbenzoic acid--CoA ligase
MAEIPCPMDVAAEKFGAETALVAGDRTFTFTEYRQLVVSVQRRLVEAGVTGGSRVVTIAENSLQHVVVLMALVRMGAVACPVNPRFPAALVDKVVAAVRADLLVLSVGASRAASVVPHLPLEDLVSVSPGGSAGDRAVMNLDRDATVILSSGSTGTPKAAVLTAGNHFFSALGSNRNIPVGPGDRWLLSLPLCHVGGLGIVFRALLGGAAVAIPSGDLDLPQALDVFRPTHLSLVPTQLYRLLHDQNAAKPATGQLKAILLGGGPVGGILVKEALKRSLPIHTSYGLTEMGSQVTTTRAGDSPEKLLTSGRLLPYREVKTATDGEIMVKGATLFSGYCAAGPVSKVTDQEGWWATGDLGRIDVDGYLTVLGRKDNMFVSGGENIHPEEIEAVLCELDDVADALVVPVRDREYGHRPVAFVKWRGTPLAGERIRREAGQRLPGIKVPIAFHEWPETATAAGLKPSRRRLAELAEERTGKDVIE